MRALKIPYHSPKDLPRAAERATVEFPERHLSYVIYDYKESDLERCALEVRKAVNAHSRSAEPGRLEIRFLDSD